ncbi:MAG: DUF5110 domain-containing protein, partial [Treponemataceae bacterium]|nr:DUF5110 domain-containing protein [Treponemataceae bacterium]
WVQNGIFQSRFSIHSVNTDNTVTEPWMYSKCTGYIRDAIKFRYQLFPYMYSLSYRANTEGLSILEPLCLAFQKDEKVAETFTEFMMGDSLFVAPVIEKGAKTRKFYLPRLDDANSGGTNCIGGAWYNFWTREEFEGGKEYEIPVGLGDVPLFVKSGAIIPIAENQMKNLASQSVTDLRLLCACDADGKFVLYEDDGLTKAYEKGEYCRTSINMTSPSEKTSEKAILDFAVEGSYKSKVEKVLLDVIYPKKCPFFVLIDGKELEKFINRKAFEKADEGWYYSQTKKSVLIKYPQSKVGSKKNCRVEISFAEFNMLGM